MGTPTRRATPRISAGLGLDAPISELVASRGLDDAFMLLTSEFLEQVGEDGPFGRHWRIFRENHRGWGRHLKLVTSGHWTFMDPTPLFDFLGTRNHLSEEDILRAFGPPELRRRAVGITRAYVRAFFDHHLRGQQAPILDEPAPEYPEIEFRWRAR